jgi:amyloid beta precursor protein binding protein 1
MRLIVDEVAVAEQKPFQVQMRDLRVNNPFPELTDYVNSVDMNDMELAEHSHTPWVVVLIKAANKWVAEKG